MVRITLIGVIMSRLPYVLFSDVVHCSVLISCPIQINTNNFRSVLSFAMKFEAVAVILKILSVKTLQL